MNQTMKTFSLLLFPSFLFFGGLGSQWTKSNVETIQVDRTEDGLCDFVFDGVDPSSMRKRKEIAPAYFFGQTKKNQVNKISDKEFLTSETSIVEMGGIYYLVLNIKIASKTAQRSYGIIQKGSPFIIHLIDETEMYIYTNLGSSGKFDPYSGYTKYQCIYQLTKGDVKNLKNLEIKDVGIMWSSGYELYDVYEIDLLMNQLNCF